MKHCPECRQEYEDFVDVCRDCEGKVRLNPGPSPGPREDPEVEPDGEGIWANMVLVSLDLPSALALVDRLKEEGVHAVVPDADAMPSYPGAVSRGAEDFAYRVFVPEAELGRALQIYEGFAAEDESAITEEASKDGEGP